VHRAPSLRGARSSCAAKDAAVRRKNEKKWETHRLLVTCSVISSVFLVVFSALQMRLLAGGYIREAKFLNFAVGMNQTKQNVESAVEKGELRSQGGDDIPGKFENIKPYIDLAEIS
jgi:hypothetical protein